MARRASHQGLVEILSALVSVWSVYIVAVSWSVVPLVSCPIGQLSHWSVVSLVSCPIGQLSHWSVVFWSVVSWSVVSWSDVIWSVVTWSVAAPLELVTCGYDFETKYP